MPLMGCEGSSPSFGTTSHRGVAQLVECAVWDREVAGSSPATPTCSIIKFAGGGSYVQLGVYYLANKRR